jgi:hypothetical protein
MRDLLDEPPETWERERARVVKEGWAASSSGTSAKTESGRPGDGALRPGRCCCSSPSGCRMAIPPHADRWRGSSGRRAAGTPYACSAFCEPATSRSFSGSMLIWAAIWTLAGIAGAMMLAIVALLTLWSYEAGVLWLFLMFLGLMATLFTLSSRKKDKDVEDDDGEDLTDMESFELEFRR